MPLDEGSKHIILMQIADYIDWFPTESVEDIPLVARALEAYLEKNDIKKIDEKIPPKMRDSLGGIISYVDPTMGYLPQDAADRSEAITAMNALISKRITSLNTMIAAEKLVYIKEYMARKERSKAAQEKMQTAKAPELGSEAHTISMEEQHLLWQQQENQTETTNSPNELIIQLQQLFLAMEEQIHHRWERERIERETELDMLPRRIAKNLLEQETRRLSGEYGEETLRQRGLEILDEAKREIDHLFASRPSYLHTDYKLPFMRNIDFLVEQGYSLDQIKAFSERQITYLFFEDYRTAANELGVRASELFDLDIETHKDIVRHPKEIKKIMRHFLLTLPGVAARCNVSSLSALIKNFHACISFIDKHNLTLEEFGRLNFYITNNTQAAESLMEELGLSLNALNDNNDSQRLNAALLHPVKIKMLKQAANLSSHDVMHLHNEILANPEAAMLIALELGGDALEQINNFKDFATIRAILDKSNLVIDLVENHNVTIDMLYKLEPNRACFRIVRGYGEFDNMSAEQLAQQILAKQPRMTEVNAQESALNDDSVSDQAIISEINRIINGPDFKWEMQKQGFFCTQETPAGVIKVREILKNEESASKKLEAINMLMQEKTGHVAPSGRSTDTIRLYDLLKSLTSNNDNQSKKDKIQKAQRYSP